MKSNLIKTFTVRYVPSSMYHAVKSAWYRLSGNRDEIGKPPKHLRFVYGFDPDYEIVGEQFLNYFVSYGGLKPDHKVLDVGCGIGRCALPLTGYLDATGEYHGFDIREDGINWCRENISRKYPNFHFTHVNLANATYQPFGKQRAEQTCFPYEDGSFDFVFSKSVCTHLKGDVIAHYLRETRRVLKPGGRCLHTFFLLNETSKSGIEKGTSQFAFCYPFEHGASVSRTEPEKAIAFDECYIRDLYKQADLEVSEPVLYGAWSGRTDGVSGQDIILASC